MSNALHTAAERPGSFRIAAGEDRFGEQRGLGISSIAFKVSGQDSTGLFILENTFHAKGEPARHLHYEQDGWFYAAEGEFLLVPTFRLPTLIHTRSGNAKWLYEISHQNPLWIHPEDAVRLRISEGTLVRIHY